jgi:hypothetical protein
MLTRDQEEDLRTAMRAFRPVEWRERPAPIVKPVRILFNDGAVYCGTAAQIQIYADSKHEQRVILSGPGHLQWFPADSVRRVFVGRV